MKKHQKSKDMQNHKKPMNPDVLQEEFSNELGDVNAFKFIDVIETIKRRTKRRRTEAG